MSDQSNHSTITNLEFLRKEAKALLRRCRARDPEAIGRTRARLPGIAELDDEHVAVEIKLADVQHAIAREWGYANWASLRRLDDESRNALDFSRPGSDGTLPDGFRPWRWGVSYTVRPELLAPVVYGKEHVICVSVLAKMPDDETFSGYADLYERANAIASARATTLTCRDEGTFLHTRILAHTWFRHDSTDLVRAAVTLGVAYLKEGDARPRGENRPTPKELAISGGMTREQLAACNINKRFDEVYSDGDIRDQSEMSYVFVFSYGEYVPTCDGIDYSPIVKRAEDLTRFHLPFIKGAPQSGKDGLKIIRREWFNATNPDIAVIHIYVQVKERETDRHWPHAGVQAGDGVRTGNAPILKAGGLYARESLDHSRNNADRRNACSFRCWHWFAPVGSA